MKEKKLDRGLLHFRKQREVEKLYSSPLFQIGNIPEAMYVFSPHQPSSFAAFAVLFFLIHYRFPRKHETGSRWLRSYINYIFVPYLHDHGPPYLSLRSSIPYSVEVTLPCD